MTFVVRATPGTRRLVGLFVLAVVPALFHSNVLVAADAEAVSVERRVRNALRRRADRTWYDARADGPRSVRLRPPRTPPQTSPTTTSGRAAPRSWDLDFRALIRIVLIAALVGAALLLVRAYRRRVAWRRGEKPPRGDESDRPGVIDVSALPDAETGEVDDWLAAADAAAEQGDFRRAMILLFGHELLLLHAAGAIALSRGKTNRQYLREARSQPPVAGPFQTAIHHFEQVYFGARALSPEQWRRLRSDEPRFHSGGAP